MDGNTTTKIATSISAVLVFITLVSIVACVGSRAAEGVVCDRNKTLERQLEQANKTLERQLEQANKEYQERQRVIWKQQDVILDQRAKIEFYETVRLKNLYMPPAD